MTIKAVFFDMGGTIETFGYTRALRLAATAGLQVQLADAGIQLGLSDESLLEMITDGLNRYKTFCLNSLIEYSPQRVWSEYILKNFSVDPASLNQVAEDLMLCIETRFYQREMRPEIPDVLNALQSMGVKIGLISNVNSRGQVPHNLKKYGIQQYFDPIVLSSEYGRRKPDPSIFHYAARLANLPTSQCLYVGDRIARDILGARRAGYGMAVQIQHDFNHGEEDGGAMPDRVICKMTELLDVLGEAQRSPYFKASFPYSRQSQVRGLIFDAGDILYYRLNRGSKFKSFLKELCLDTEANHRAEKEALDYKAYRGMISLEDYREGILRLWGVTQPDEIERGKQVIAEEENDVLFFAGVRETLETLKARGYLLGILTDTSAPMHTKLTWFERAGIGALWDSFISSNELGTRKPDPVMYQAALRQLGLCAEQAVFVGHKASELDGARAVGMKTIAFNRDPDATADFITDQFSGILDFPVLDLGLNQEVS